MPAEQKCVPTTRTVRLRIAATANAGKVSRPGGHGRGGGSGRRLLHPAVPRSSPGVFEAKKPVVLKDGPEAGPTKDVAWTDKDRLTWAESVTVATPAHPDIAPERDFEEEWPGAPRHLRRAAIHAAAGAVQGYLRNLHRWEAGNPKRRGRRPKPPGPHPHLTAYGQRAQVRQANYRQDFVRLKVQQGARWGWVNFPVRAPRYLRRPAAGVRPGAGADGGRANRAEAADGG